jgi:hypothetical protein
MTKNFDHGYALLVAVDQNAVPSAALPDVAKDLAALRDVLVHPERCGYAVGNVRTMTDKDSTRDGIMAGLDWLRDKLKADPSGDATALVYFTGHGHVDSDSYYLIPYDVNLSRIRTSAIRAEDFSADIAALQPRRLLVVLDCCHAAGMDVKDFTAGASALHSVAVPPALFMRGEKGISSAAGVKGLEALAGGAGRAVLSSSQASEQSYVRKDRKMSIFTYHLIEALTGHAQPQAGATEVLVSDLMSHVYRRVSQSAKSDWQTDQHPQYEVSGNFPVALLLGGKGLSKGEVPPSPLEPAPAPPPAATTYQATLTGSGAIAQGSGATAVGAGGVNVGGKNTGNINTGTQTNIETGGGAYVGGGVDNRRWRLRRP